MSDAAHAEETWQIGSTRWAVGDSAPLHTSVLFIDLVNSTDLASVMSLEEYADFASCFGATCREHVDYFFETYHASKYHQDGRNYRVSIAGDELVVFLHTDRPHDDVYQLVCLSIALKCAWLGVPLNAERIRSGRSTFELAAGIHSGPVWASRTAEGFDLSGFAINLAKRVESVSRQGERFRIFVSDPAFKQVNLRMRNLLLGQRQILSLKGVVEPVGVHEVVDSFVDVSRRLPSDSFKAFAQVAREALSTNSFDLWIHSCLQVAAGAAHGRVVDEDMELSRKVLNIDPRNPVALYYQADGWRERGELERARLDLEDLTAFWPTFGDGWLALAEVLEAQGEPEQAARCRRQALRHGIPDAQAVKS